MIYGTPSIVQPGLPRALRSGGPRWQALAAPAAEPLTVQEVKLALRIDTDDDDATLTRLIVAAREKIERDTNHLLTTRQVQVTRDDWHGPNYETSSNIVFLLPGPVSSIDDVQYVVGGTLTSLDASAYQVDLARVPARLAPALNRQWPTLDPVMNAVQITMTVGYASPDAIPENVQQALYLLIAHWNENREPYQQDGREPVEVPLAYWSLINTLVRGSELL